MVNCKVIVVRTRGDQSEDWGELVFLGLPSPGDRIMVVREECENYATVLSVHHYPSATGSDLPPKAEVVAKWTGAGRKIR